MGWVQLLTRWDLLGPLPELGGQEESPLVKDHLLREQGTMSGLGLTPNNGDQTHHGTLGCGSWNSQS